MTAASGDTHAAGVRLPDEIDFGNAVRRALTKHIPNELARFLAGEADGALAPLIADLLAASPPPDSLRARLVALRGLSEAATPGPWRYDIEFTKSDADPMVPDYWCVDINQGDAHNEATVAYYSTLEDPTANAEFIVGCVNLARELLAEDAAVNHVRAGMETP